MTKGRESVGKESLEFAWRTHDAIDSWTSKVDTKSSITVGLVTATLGYVVSTSSGEGPLATLSGFDLFVWRVGVVALLLALLMAVLVFSPQLRRRKLTKEHDDNSIFFGHLKHWEPDRLAKHWSSDGFSPLDELSRQVVAMSKIAYKKHLWLQVSVILYVISLTMILTALA